jgi:hypothetical protein
LRPAKLPRSEQRARRRCELEWVNPTGSNDCREVRLRLWSGVGSLPSGRRPRVSEIANGAFDTHGSLALRRTTGRQAEFEATRREGSLAPGPTVPEASC